MSIKESIMGIAANQFRILFLTASKSDIEFKILNLNRKRVALMDSAARIASKFSNSIFQSGQHSDLYGGQIPGMLPGFIGDNPFIDSSNQTNIPEGDFEAQMAILHSMDRGYELEVKRLDMFHQTKKTEIDSVKEILKKNTEKDFKTFG